MYYGVTLLALANSRGHRKKARALPPLTVLIVVPESFAERDVAVRNSSIC